MINTIDGLDVGVVISHYAIRSTGRAKERPQFLLLVAHPTFVERAWKTSRIHQTAKWKLAVVAKLNQHPSSTKERHYVPCTASEEGTSSEATADMLIKEVFRIHGLHASIVSDRGPQFIATVWKSFCKRLVIQAKLSTAFHPETDGQSERSNQDVERHLRTYCSYLQDDWVKWLPIAEFADNNAVSASTGVSAFYANKGFDPRMSFGPDTTDYTSTRQRLDAARAEDITDKMQNILDFVRQNLDVAQIRMAEQANKHRKDVTFKVGDMVFLSNKNINNERPSRKLDNKKWGPFKIIELIGS